MRSHLSRLRSTALDAKRTCRLSFALGNEAGDLDSIVSSIAASWMLSQQNSDDGVVQVVPCMPFERRDFRLRRDAVMLFRTGSLEETWEFDEKDEAPTCLLYLDELSRAFRKDLGDDVVLTDHNRAGPHICDTLGFARPEMVPVRAIIDHHADEHMYPDAHPRVVRLDAGSACTLFCHPPILLHHQRLEAFPTELRRLLFGTIVMDTRNLNPEKSFKSDEEALRALGDETSMNDSTRQSLFEALKTARADVSSFGVGDLMRLDYKEVWNVSESVSKVGFSSLFSSLEEICPKCEGESLAREMETFARERNLAAFIALFPPHFSQGGRKSLAIYASRDPDLVQFVKRALGDSPAGMRAELLSSEIFKIQDIPNKGFGLQEHPTHPPLSPDGRLSVGTMRKAVTRKTLLPTVIDILKRYPSKI